MTTNTNRGRVGLVIYSPVISVCSRGVAVYQQKKVCQAKTNTTQRGAHEIPSEQSKVPVLVSTSCPPRDALTLQRPLRNTAVYPWVGLQELDLPFLSVFSCILHFIIHHMSFQCRFPHAHCAPHLPENPNSGSTKTSHFSVLMPGLLSPPGDNHRPALIMAMINSWLPTPGRPYSLAAISFILHSGHFKHSPLASYLLFLLWIDSPPMSFLCTDCLTLTDSIIWLFAFWLSVGFCQGRHQQKNQREREQKIGFAVSLFPCFLSASSWVSLVSLLGN